MDYGWGFGHGAIATGAIVLQLFIAFIAFAVVAGLIFLLVRFLLVATRAAQLYVNQHDTARLPQAPEATRPSHPVGAEDVTTPPTTTPPATAPGEEPPTTGPAATRPKKPKA